MNFKVHSVPHTLFAAVGLVHELRKLGHSAQLVDRINPHDHDVHIIYAANRVHKLPTNYIVYQTEVAKSQHFSPHYLKVLQDALAVWEYAPANIPAYENVQRNITVVPPGYRQHPNNPKSIPVLFYGHIEGSLRRQQWLQVLQRKVGCEIVTNKLNQHMWALLRQALVVVNIHYYDNSPLELFRIHEALSFNCHVVSEGPVQLPYHQWVHFVDNPLDMVRAVYDLLQTRPAPHQVIQLSNTEQVEQALSRLKVVT